MLSSFLTNNASAWTGDETEILNAKLSKTMVLAYLNKDNRGMCAPTEIPCLCVHPQRHALLSTLRLSHQSHCFSFKPSYPINRTTHNSLRRIIRIERRCDLLLYASTDTSLSSTSNQGVSAVCRRRESKEIHCHLVRERKAEEQAAKKRGILLSNGLIKTLWWEIRFFRDFTLLSSSVYRVIFTVCSLTDSTTTGTFGVCIQRYVGFFK